MPHKWDTDTLCFIQVLKYHPAIKRNELLRQQHGQSQMEQMKWLRYVGSHFHSTVKIAKIHGKRTDH